jgi:hypothetical protein
VHSSEFDVPLNTAIVGFAIRCFNQVCELGFAIRFFNHGADQGGDDPILSGKGSDFEGQNQNQILC